MKKLLPGIFLSLLALSAATTLRAQATFTIQDSIISYASGPVDLHGIVTNISSGNLQLEWKKVGVTMNAQQFLSMCDNNNCYTSAQAMTANVFTSGTIHTSGTADWYGSFDGATVPPGGSVYYTINLKDVNSGYNKNVTYVLRKFSTGIANTAPADYNIGFYPNPAHGTLNLTFDENAGVKSVAIYNLIGKSVSNYKISGSNAQLDIDDIPAGIYMLRFMNAQGDVLATRRFTKQ